MPFIADTTSMKVSKDKKRKADVLSEESIPDSAAIADPETKDSETATEPEPKKKRSKEEKRLKKEKRSKEDEPLDEETSSKNSKEETRSKKEKRTRETAVVVSEQVDDANQESGGEGEVDGALPSKKRRLSVDEIEVDITAPEPPSKKALRRLKKGKPLPPSKSGADSSPEPEAKKEKKAEVEKRSGHGVWIGNLPWSVSKVELCNWLVEKSDLTEENITRVHMPGPNDNKPANKVEKKFSKPVHNKGFAYVDFQNADQVKLAIELSEQLLTGRRLLIKDSKSFEGRPAKEEAKIDGKPPSKKIFVGNLRFDATEETLKEHFEKCGTIEHVHVATFEDSGKCKGFAWVTFETVEAATSAVKGYVYIKEEVSDESESESESEADDSDAESGDESEKKEKPKKTVMKKWWVNKIQGRPLRMEFAEDSQVRYKKRYGKDGTKNNAGGGLEEAGAGADAGDVPVRSAPAREHKVIPKKVEYRSSYAPRLTGGIVESKGKKITF
ncbi:Nucleolar protein 13 [Clarireedia jacksonii]